MASYDLSIVNADVVLPGGEPARVDIGVRDGRIAAIAAGGIEAERTLDATGLVVLPGLVDEHFHVFRGYPWETYENATRAAIKGGVTSVVDMPLDNPPTLTAERLRDKLDAIAGACHVDYACFGGYLAEDPDEMARMAEAGASAFKLFTGGVAPPGMYPGVDDGQLLDALRRAAALGRPTTVHSENPGMVDFETARMQAEGRDDLGAWDDARPWFSETAAAQTVALAAHAAGARVVIAHVSSPGDGRCDRRRPAPRRGRLGRDVPPLPVHDARGVRGRPAQQVEPADAQGGLGRPAVGARARGAHPHGRQRPRAAAQGGRRDGVDDAARVRQRRRADVPRVRDTGAARARRLARADRRAHVHGSGAAVRPRPAQGRHPDRRRRGLRDRGDERAQGARRERPRVPRPGALVAVRRAWSCGSIPSTPCWAAESPSRRARCSARPATVPSSAPELRQRSRGSARPPRPPPRRRRTSSAARRTRAARPCGCAAPRGRGGAGRSGSRRCWPR